MYFVYILESLKRKRYYIGSSADVYERLKQHNAGYAKSTKPYRPWVLVYKEQYNTKQEATKREWHLKHPAGYLEKKTIIEQYCQRNGGFA